jgi:hypothetical protein
MISSFILLKNGDIVKTFVCIATILTCACVFSMLRAFIEFFWNSKCTYIKKLDLNNLLDAINIEELIINISNFLKNDHGIKIDQSDSSIYKTNIYTNDYKINIESCNESDDEVWGFFVILDLPNYDKPTNVQFRIDDIYSKNRKYVFI